MNVPAPRRERGQGEGAVPRATCEPERTAGVGQPTRLPVTVWEPAAWVEDLAPGTEVVVVGGVRRRFFRTATGTSATRVDVEAGFIGRAGQRRQLEGAMRRIETALEALMP